MGRAYSVRERSIQKTGAQKGKLYTTYGKEIFKIAKSGGTDLESNSSLKRIVAKAKKDQVPNDIITRAIERAKGNTKDEYKEVLYEGFGPGSSTLIVKCLTDNVNRTVSLVRLAFSKVGKTLGVQNSVSYNYDFLAIITVKEKEEDVLNALIRYNIDIVDMENNDGFIDITVLPKDYDLLKDALEDTFKDVDYIFDEIGLFARDGVTLDEEELKDFEKLLELLNEIEDVDKIYHNVIL